MNCGFIISASLDTTVEVLTWASRIANIGTRTVTGPFTVVFPPPSSGIIVVNPTGYTAAGRPFITVSGALGRRSSLHIAILVRNPSKVPLGTFFLGFPISIQ